MALRAFERPDLTDLVELIETMDNDMNTLRGHVQHAKEMTAEYEEFPTLANHVCMELARENVLHLLKDTAEKLSSFYSVRLTPVEKRLFPFSVFRMTFEEMIYHNGD